jgi:hypothetical protein
VSLPLPGLEEPAWGRRVLITVTGPAAGLPDGRELVVCDWDDARPGGDPGAGSSLACAFEVEQHLEGEPQHARVTVYGFSRDRRREILALVQQARRRSYRERAFTRAGRLSLAAGRPEAFGPLLDCAVLRAKPGRDGADWRIEFECVDGRQQWEEGVVRESTGEGVDLATAEEVLRAGLAFEAGEDPFGAFRRAFPELVAEAGPEAGSNRVMLGSSREANRDVAREMGLREFWALGQLRYIPADAARGEPAVVLSVAESALHFEVDERGFGDLECLMDHRICPGRQVTILGEDGLPIGAPTYRIERAAHRGATWEPGWRTAATLRPSTMLGAGPEVAGA